MHGVFKVKEVHQGGRWYILDNGMIVHYERLKPYVQRVTEMQLDMRPATNPNDPSPDLNPGPDDVDLPPDPQETAFNEEIPPESDLSSQGTFDAETDSELSFDEFKIKEIPSSDRALRPQPAADYYKVANPDDFEFFAIREATELEIDEDDRRALYEMDSAVLPVEHYARTDRVIDWIMDQQSRIHERHLCEVTEEMNSPDESPEPMEVEDFCRKIILIKYVCMDFLNCGMPLVVATTADFQMSSGLPAALDRELNNREFLFSQRMRVGEVASMPRFSSRSHRGIYYLVLKARERDVARRKDMENSIWSLLAVARDKGERVLAFPAVDKWRFPFEWKEWYDLIHEVFAYSSIEIRVMEYYYLSHH